MNKFKFSKSIESLIVIFVFISIITTYCFNNYINDLTSQSEIKSGFNEYLSSDYKTLDEVENEIKFENEFVSTNISFMDINNFNVLITDFDKSKICSKLLEKGKCNGDVVLSQKFNYKLKNEVNSSGIINENLSKIYSIDAIVNLNSIPNKNETIVDSIITQNEIKSTGYVKSELISGRQNYFASKNRFNKATNYSYIFILVCALIIINLHLLKIVHYINVLIVLGISLRKLFTNIIYKLLFYLVSPIIALICYNLIYHLNGILFYDDFFFQYKLVLIDYFKYFLLISFYFGIIFLNVVILCLVEKKFKIINKS